MYHEVLVRIILITNTESFGQWSKEKINFLIPITQLVSIGINLFQLNETLSKSLGSERAIRDIILENQKTEKSRFYIKLLTE